MVNARQIPSGGNAQSYKSHYYKVVIKANFPYWHDPLVDAGAKRDNAQRNEDRCDSDEHPGEVGCSVRDNDAWR